jgi:hypothetical protein
VVDFGCIDCCNADIAGDVDAGPGSGELCIDSGAVVGKVVEADASSVDDGLVGPFESGSVSPRRRLLPRVVLSFKPKEVALSNI